jgi:hypothetical protein
MEGLMKKILILYVLACFVFLLLSTITFGISWFEKEKEVPDGYLTKLFALGFPYDSIRVEEDSKGRPFIVIRARDKIEGKTLREHNDLLLNSGVMLIYPQLYPGYSMPEEEQNLGTFKIGVSAGWILLFICIPILMLLYILLWRGVRFHNGKRIDHQ